MNNKNLIFLILTANSNCMQTNGASNNETPRKQMAGLGTASNGSGFLRRSDAASNRASSPMAKIMEALMSVQPQVLNKNLESTEVGESSLCLSNNDDSNIGNPTNISNKLTERNLLVSPETISESLFSSANNNDLNAESLAIANNDSTKSDCKSSENNTSTLGKIKNNLTSNKIERYIFIVSSFMLTASVFFLVYKTYKNGFKNLFNSKANIFANIFAILSLVSLVRSFALK